MISRVNTVAFMGLEPKEVQVQAHIANGIPNFVIVGLVNKAVAEARERIRAAINSIGLSLPAKRVVINLAPASFAKEGTRFDLPIAIAILVSMGVIEQNAVDGKLVLGELFLDGGIGGVRGVLPVCVHASRLGFGLICPSQNAGECSILKDKVPIIAPSSLAQLVDYLKDNNETGSTLSGNPISGDTIYGNLADYASTNDSSQQALSAIELGEPMDPKKEWTELQMGPQMGLQTGLQDIPNLSGLAPTCADMGDIRGQYAAKRASIVAACGGHNILLSGHPGTGKSMLASAFAGLLPPLTEDEAIEVTSIYSLAGLTRGGNIMKDRPYRAPHHSASSASILGGGKSGQLGEITLAHRGVLFLDELPEFERSVLDGLRQPLENGQISIARADYRVSYPAKFQLFAAMNQCKCGYFGDQGRQCRRVPQCGLDYEGRVSGPIMDRIDIVVQVETETDLLYIDPQERQQSSKEIAAIVASVRQIQSERYRGDDSGIMVNAELSTAGVQRYCQIDSESKAVMQKYADKFGLSMRGYTRVLKVARTIADIDGVQNIQKDHVIEALNYRKRWSKWQ